MSIEGTEVRNLISEEILLPLVEETLLQLSRQGCLPGIRRNPAKHALKSLGHHDLEPALTLIINKQNKAEAAINDYLIGPKRDGTFLLTLDPQLFENNFFIRQLRFWSALGSVVKTVCTDNELAVSRRSTGNLIPVAINVNGMGKLNHAPSGHVLTIPDNPQGQLEVVKTLGPLIFPHWNKI